MISGTASSMFCSAESVPSNTEVGEMSGAFEEAEVSAILHFAIGLGNHVR